MAWTDGLPENIMPLALASSFRIRTEDNTGHKETNLSAVLQKTFSEREVCRMKGDIKMAWVGKKLNFIQASKKKGCLCALSYVLWGREGGIVSYMEQSQGQRVTGIITSWHDWWKHTRHTSMHIHRYTHTRSVIKNMIKGTVELITSLAVYMTTHVEHLCLPPFIVLLCLILFSSEMIMISLAVKYKCKFTSILPAKKQNCQQESIIIYCRQRSGAFLKENTLNHRQTNFIFLSPARLCHTLIHLSLCSIMHVDSSTRAAPLGTSLWNSPKTTAASHPCISKKEMWSVF